MRLEGRKYLADIQRAAALLSDFTAGKTFAEYAANAMLRAAVERQFEVVGEALSQLAKHDAALAARISSHRQIIAFRNILIHGYADVDDELVWDIVQTKLPALRAGVETLLGED